LSQCWVKLTRVSIKQNSSLKTILFSWHTSLKKSYGSKFLCYALPMCFKQCVCKKRLKLLLVKAFYQIWLKVTSIYNFESNHVSNLTQIDSKCIFWVHLSQNDIQSLYSLYTITNVWVRIDSILDQIWLNIESNLTQYWVKFNMQIPIGVKFESNLSHFESILRHIYHTNLDPCPIWVIIVLWFSSSSTVPAAMLLMSYIDKYKDIEQGGRETN